MGLYLKKELDNEAVIGVWQITETEEELKELSSTPSDEMEEISFIRSESLRKQRLAVRALLWRRSRSSAANPCGSSAWPCAPSSTRCSTRRCT